MDKSNYTTTDIKKIDERHKAGGLISFEDYAKLYPHPITHDEWIALPIEDNRKIRSMKLGWCDLAEMGISAYQVRHLDLYDLYGLKYDWETNHKSLVSGRKFWKGVHTVLYEIGRLIKAICCIPQ